MKDKTITTACRCAKCHDTMAIGTAFVWCNMGTYRSPTWRPTHANGCEKLRKEVKPFSYSEMKWDFGQVGE